MTDPFRLDGRVAVISGAAGWLGTAMVGGLLDAGATVVAVGRDEARLKGLRDRYDVEEGRLETQSCDVTTDGWPDLLARVAADRGRIDVLVNNAHVGRGGSLATSTPEDFHEATSLSLVAAATAMNAARDGLLAARDAGGSPGVVNVASMYGMVAPDPRLYDAEEKRNPPFYGAAKAGLLELTRYAAAELGPLGIRVNAISPGPVPGPAAQEDTEFRARLAERTMLGRIGTPEDVAGALVYLASPAAAFVTGTNLVVDGGWTAW